MAVKAKPTEQLETLENAVWIPRASIYVDPEQPRKFFEPVALAELTESIKELGILQPLVVVHEPSRYDGTPFKLRAGERRFRASDEVLDKLPCIIADVPPERAREVALAENIHRQDLLPIEEAQAVVELMNDRQLSTRGVARALKVSEGWVNNRLALIKAGDDVKAVAAAQEYSMSSLLLVDKVADPDQREELLEAVKSGAPHKAIKTRVEAYQEQQKRVADTRHAPDRQTEQRAKLNRQNGGGNVSRGEAVTGAPPVEAKEMVNVTLAEIERHLMSLKAWLPLLNTIDRKTAQKKLEKAVGGVIDA